MFGVGCRQSRHMLRKCLQGSSEERESRKNLQKQLSDERRVSFGISNV